MSKAKTYSHYVSKRCKQSRNNPGNNSCCDWLIQTLYLQCSKCFSSLPYDDSLFLWFNLLIYILTLHDPDSNLEIIETNLNQIWRRQEQIGNRYRVNNPIVEDSQQTTDDGHLTSNLIAHLWPFCGQVSQIMFPLNYFRLEWPLKTRLGEHASYIEKKIEIALGCHWDQSQRSLAFKHLTQ